MKKKIILLSLALITLLIAPTVKADDGFKEPKLIRCTCYTWTGNKTASGCYPYEGIIASKKEYLGYVAVLYTKDMELIGYFEVRDTGAGIDTDGDGKGDSIKNGKSIDVYRDTLDECYEWVSKYGDYIYVQFVKAEG